jgi:EspG family
MSQDAAQFGLVELDLLATFAGARPPFPLQVPSFGRVQPERELLLGAAGDTLQARGLADEDGPLALADRLVTLLAGRRGAVDLVLGGPGWESGAVALADGMGAVLCLQRFNPDEHHIVDAYCVDRDALAEELFALVPRRSGGAAMPIRLPLRAMRAAHDVLTSATGDVQATVYQVLSDGGVDAASANKLASMLHPLEGYGQMGVTRPTSKGEDVRVSDELSWLDTPAGRYRVSSVDGWVSVNPLHPDELFGILRDFASQAAKT